MAQGNDVNARECEAWTVEKGDILANLGVVVSRTHVGAFYVFEVRGTIHKLSTGRLDVDTFDVVRHSHETVVVTR